jgi:adenylate cyclase
MDGVVRHYPIFSTLISADGILRLLAPLAVQAYILGYSLDANKIEYNSDRRILKLGDVKIPVNRSGQALLDFCGEGSYRILLTEEKEGLIPAVSAVDIIEEKDEVKLASIFKDNIVFLGVTEIGVGDYVATPTSPTFPGVEVHATLLENMLSGRLFTPESPTVANDLYLALVIGLVIGLITRASKPILGLILVLTIVIGCNWFVYKRFLHGEYLRSIYPSLLIFGVYGTTTIFKFTREIKNKALIRSMFHHYLSPSVVGELLKDPSKLKLGGEKKIATVFFSDVEGFTPISEKLAPEQVSDIMNLYFASVSDIILRQGGYVDKYIGDGVMAVFGVPIPQEDHALRACLSAIESVKAISALRNELVQRGLPEINIRIGINTGELIVGNMGSKSRLNYTVMGDTVNIASRLEAINKELKTRIAIGEQTYIQVKDILKTREYKDVHIKGKAEALTVYEVLVEQDGTSNTQKEN